MTSKRAKASSATGGSAPANGSASAADTTHRDGDAIDTGKADEISGLTFEEARDELAAVVDRLHTGGQGLQESLALWERGELLAQRCESVLAQARQRVAALTGDTEPDAEHTGPTRGA